jgi:hypothetical protein
MWVLRDTACVRPVLIEIEDPGKPWFSPSNRRPSAKLTQALDQLVEWKVWFAEPENQLVFRRRYVPADFHDRQLEPEYVLIYGRNAEFRTGTSSHAEFAVIRRKRDYMRRRNEHFLTYDMLRPDENASNWVTLTSGAAGLVLARIPPTFSTGPASRELAALIPDIAPALAATPLMSDLRKRYLSKRWRYWRDSTLPSRAFAEGYYGE